LSFSPSRWKTGRCLIRNATWTAFLDSLDERVEQGKSVAIHCRAGMGAPSMLCACLLVRQGFSAESGFQKIQVARGCAVPDTTEQRNWVESFASRPKPLVVNPENAKAIEEGARPEVAVLQAKHNKVWYNARHEIGGVRARRLRRAARGGDPQWRTPNCWRGLMRRLRRRVC
jgi:hypothetical protein